MVNLYIFKESSRAAIYGIGTYIRELTAALKDSDINVCVVHLRSEKVDDEPTKTNGIQHWHFPPPINRYISSDWYRQNEIYYRNIVYLLRLQIKNTENLVFHLNHNHSAPLTKELKKAFYCKTVSVVHYLDWCFSLLGNVTRFKKLLSIQVTDQHDEIKKSIIKSYQEEKEFFEIVDRIICLSENTRQILMDDYRINPEIISVIYNGLTDSIPVSDKQSLRQKHLMPDIPVILFAGRLEENKGLTYLLRAFKMVLNKFPHCQLIIAGNGAFNVCMNECEDIWTHVTWTGLVKKDKLYELYSIADIGVMPSFHEQCSFVVIEMMMHGLPVIATATSGLNEIVDDTCGIKIPVIEHPDSKEIDVSLLAEKIRCLLQNPEERQRLGANARRRYETVYSAEIFRKNMTGFYHTLYK